MAATDPQAFFLTPPPRHLAELRIDTAPSAVAFSAPCGATTGKRRCLLPASSVRKRMLLELDPFEVAPAPSSTPPPPPSPPPSPTASRAGAPFSLAGESSFRPTLQVVPPASPGNIFAFGENAARTPAGSEARSAMSFLVPLGQAAKHADATATGVPSFLAAPERPKTPTATGPTANGGFVFAAPPEGSLTPTSTNTSGGLSFLASPKQPLTPMGSTATGGFLAPSDSSLMLAGKCAIVPPISLKTACTGSTGTGDFAFPSPGPACTKVGPAPSACAAAKGSIPLAGLATPPPLHNSGDGSHKRQSLFLRRAATSAQRKSLRQLEEQQQLIPQPQKIAKANSLAAGEAARSSIMSGSSASPCCTFFTSLSKEAAKQEAKKAFSEASRSLAGSPCSSPARPATPEKENKQEREVEVSSSPRERSPTSPRERAPTSPAVVCSGAEVMVHVTCKCGVHKDFCFDHRL